MRRKQRPLRQSPATPGWSIKYGADDLTTERAVADLARIDGASGWLRRALEAMAKGEAPRAAFEPRRYTRPQMSVGYRLMRHRILVAAGQSKRRAANRALEDTSAEFSRESPTIKNATKTWRGWWDAEWRDLRAKFGPGVSDAELAGKVLAAIERWRERSTAEKKETKKRRLKSVRI